MIGDVPAIVLKASTANAASLRGVIVNDRHLTVQVSAGPIHFTEENEAKVLQVDGVYKRLHMLSITDNGRAFSPSQVADRESRDNQDFTKGLGYFKPPYDQRYFADYTYQLQSCPCLGGPVVVFHSAVRDDQHGDGSMRIDAGSGRIQELSYTPNVMPNHARTGTTNEFFGEPVPGMWTVVRIERTYSGRVALFGAHGNVVETDDHFARYPSLAEGLTALGRSTASYLELHYFDWIAFIAANTGIAGVLGH